jgi:LysR family glycine cleavage system transcriptional activator
MHELPPLNALKAFDSVARHESVSHAANELCVTPGAITKQIQHLESFLGVPLFIRRHRQIILKKQYFKNSLVHYIFYQMVNTSCP